MSEAEPIFEPVHYSSLDDFNSTTFRKEERERKRAEKEWAKSARTARLTTDRDEAYSQHFAGKEQLEQGMAADLALAQDIFRPNLSEEGKRARSMDRVSWLLQFHHTLDRSTASVAQTFEELQDEFDIEMQMLSLRIASNSKPPI